MTAEDLALRIAESTRFISVALLSAAVSASSVITSTNLPTDAMVLLGDGAICPLLAGLTPLLARMAALQENITACRTLVLVGLVVDMAWEFYLVVTPGDGAKHFCLAIDC